MQRSLLFHNITEVFLNRLDIRELPKKCLLLLPRFCVLKKWVHSRIGQCVRPSVYTITLHNCIRLSWNFVHRIVSSISRSSSKMRRIRQEIVELSKKLPFLSRPSLRGSTGIFSKKCSFSKLFKNIYESTQFLTLIPNMILVFGEIVVF